MKRKICVVTGSRADYGLLRWLMQEIRDDPTLELQVIATGMHLSRTFGLTYKEIEKDGFNIDYKFEALSNDDSAIGIAKSISNVITGCAEAFDVLKPDIVVALGDRFEIFGAASAALVARIPVAHLHGGESTIGAFDEAFRHSITKMSHLHFVAAEKYRSRVIQLGESPENVFLVGGLGLDNINKLQLMSKSDLEKSLKLKFREKNLLVTFHPVTLEDHTAEQQVDQLLKALSKLKETTVIFTLPNADTGGQKIIKIIKNYVLNNANAYVFSSLGQVLYLSCMAHVDAVVGNSSSGLIEAPSLNKGTLNIGDRQAGRLQATSVINCEPEMVSILEGLRKLYSVDFQVKLPQTINPYGNGGASAKVVDILRTISIDEIVKKTFYDL
jgi:GDP/UDP-N,N'-diacetylbacillosamine 2-epimerase (hydrolysing)